MLWYAHFPGPTDPRTEIPSAGLLPDRPKRANPYLHADKEMRKLLQAALDRPFQRERRAFRPWICNCLLGLLAAFGI